MCITVWHLLMPDTGIRTGVWYPQRLHICSQSPSSFLSMTVIAYDHTYRCVSLTWLPFTWYGNITDKMMFGKIENLMKHQRRVSAVIWDHFYTTSSTESWVLTSPNENIFLVNGFLCGEFTCHMWILLTKASDAERWCFLWSVPELTAEYTIAMLVVWDAIALIMTSL